MTDPSENVTVEAATEGIAHPIEEVLSVYPLREASEDPGWAIKTAWVWISISLGLYIFFLVLLVLGIWYD